MLLRFRLENSRSFRSLGEISMVQSNLQGPKVPTIKLQQLTDTEVLPCALIYGANASGKSNLIKAIQFYREAILSSHNKGSPSGGVPRVPFATEEMQGLESLHEADFVVDDVRYTLGFTCDDEKFSEEWLYSYPEGKKRVLYERSGDEVVFGGKFLGPKKQLVEFMRPNSLFISTATQNDHPSLSRLVAALSEWKEFSFTSVTKSMVDIEFKNADIDPRVIKFLGFVGTGVVGFKSHAVDVPEEFRGLTREFYGLLKNRFDDLPEREIEEDETRLEVELGHRSTNEEVFFLDLNRESSGTRRMLLLMNRVFRALDSGSLMIVDELDLSLHTLASEEIVNLFQNEKTNPNGAQLIATTHDTNLLSMTKLRRDQIWFCERGEDGGSEIYSLAEVKSRHSDNFEKGYLGGRYGAIPYAGSVEVLFGATK